MSTGQTQASETDPTGRLDIISRVRAMNEGLDELERVKPRSRYSRFEGTASYRCCPLRDSSTEMRACSQRLRIGFVLDCKHDVLLKLFEALSLYWFESSSSRSIESRWSSLVGMVFYSRSSRAVYYSGLRRACGAGIKRGRRHL